MCSACRFCLSVYLDLSPLGIADRKSTRLNSSHSQISYAVFCVKKITAVSPWQPFFAIVLSLALLGSHAAWAQTPEIVIGVIYPMSGSTSAAGLDHKPAFAIAAW